MGFNIGRMILIIAFLNTDNDELFLTITLSVFYSLKAFGKKEF